MGLARSTFYSVSPAPLERDELVARIAAICDEFECYGYHRGGAALRHRGVVVRTADMTMMSLSIHPDSLQNFAKNLWTECPFCTATSWQMLALRAAAVFGHSSWPLAT